jgi:hypothetical protein
MRPSPGVTSLQYEESSFSHPVATLSTMSSSALAGTEKVKRAVINANTLGHLYLFWMIQIGFIIRQIKARNARNS